MDGANSLLQMDPFGQAGEDKSGAQKEEAATTAPESTEKAERQQERA